MIQNPALQGGGTSAGQWIDLPVAATNAPDLTTYGLAVMEFDKLPCYIVLGGEGFLNGHGNLYAVIANNSNYDSLNGFSLSAPLDINLIKQPTIDEGAKEGSLRITGNAVSLELSTALKWKYMYIPSSA